MQMEVAGEDRRQMLRVALQDRVSRRAQVIERRLMERRG